MKIVLQLRIEISACFSVNFQFRAEVKKVTSRAENPSARAMAQASSAWAHHYISHIKYQSAVAHVHALTTPLTLNGQGYHFTSAWSHISVWCFLHLVSVDSDS